MVFARRLSVLVVVLSLVVVAVLGVFVVPAVAGSSGVGTGDPQFRLAVREAQARGAAWRARLRAEATPRAVASSHTAYEGESSAGALAIADAKFPGAMMDAVYMRPPLASGEQIVKYGDHQALVSAPGGRRAVLVSPSLPLIGSTPSGSRAPIDLRLVEAGGAFRAASSAAVVALPTSGSGEVRFLDQGFGFSLAGANSQPAALSHDRLFYGNVEGAADSVDAVVAARQTGVEYSLILRSAFSPVSQSLRFSLPVGGRLELDGSGPGASVRVLGGDGKPLGVVMPAAASDAIGAPIGVSYSVSGDSLTMHVAPTASTVFPVFVDPLVASWDPGMYDYWTFSASPAAEFSSAENSGYTQTQDAQLNVGSSGNYGTWVYHSIYNAYIYEEYNYEVYNFFSGDDETAGILGAGGAWEAGTWADAVPSGSAGPGGSGGPNAMRGQFAAEWNINSDYCARGSNLGVANGGCPVPSHGLISANNQAETAFYYLVNPPTQTATVDAYGNWLYESDDQVPQISVSHSGYAPGSWSSSFTDNAAVSASTNGGLGMYDLSVGPPVNQTVYNSGSSYPWPTSMSHTFSYSSASLSEGTSTITASAATISGESASSSWTVKVDRTKPTVTESGTAWHPTGGIMPPGPQTIAVSAADANSGVQSISMHVDSNAPQTQNNTCNPGANQGCNNTQNATFSFDCSNYTAGQHTITVTTSDDATPANVQTDSETVNCGTGSVISGIVTPCDKSAGTISQGYVAGIYESLQTEPAGPNANKVCYQVADPLGVVDTSGELLIDNTIPVISSPQLVPGDVCSNPIVTETTLLGTFAIKDQPSGSNVGAVCADGPGVSYSLIMPAVSGGTPQIQPSQDTPPTQLVSPSPWPSVPSAQCVNSGGTMLVDDNIEGTQVWLADAVMTGSGTASVCAREQNASGAGKGGVITVNPNSLPIVFGTSPTVTGYCPTPISDTGVPPWYLNLDYSGQNTNPTSFCVTAGQTGQNPIVAERVYAGTQSGGTGFTPDP